MAERTSRRAQQAQDELRQIVGFSTTDEIEKLERLKASGTISNEEIYPATSPIGCVAANVHGIAARAVAAGDAGGRPAGASAVFEQVGSCLLIGHGRLAFSPRAQSGPRVGPGHPRGSSGQARG
jgi:hypothetical protein